MRFPEYVPKPVQQEIASILDGDERNTFAWEADIARIEKQIRDFEQESSECDAKRLKGLSRRKAEYIKRRDRLANSLSCQQRLACDERMENVFGLLCDFSDEQCRTFIRAAWDAQWDYSAIREKYDVAKQLKEKIADTADNLAELIYQFRRTGVTVPGEFDCVPELLMKTNVETIPFHKDFSSFMLKFILEYQQAHEMEDDEIQQRGFAVGDMGKPLPPECFEDWWELSPSFTQLLETLARAARNLKPNIGGLPDVVLTEQENAKTEYLRAFVLRLKRSQLIPMSEIIEKAIVITANVVRNSPNVDVVRVDVKNAINKIGMQENS